uniref:Ig-like domain-containing protein n=1 Tax=Laticauda laticaudata TaxID=8630 RepID=A0A8C5RN75_LATLA
MLIQWEKDGHPLQISKHLGVTKSGSLKINNLEASDIGVYKCVAGSAQEIFVLKLIGTSNRLLEPATSRKEAGETTDHNESNSFGAKWHQINQIWQLWSQKSQQYLRDEQVNDQPALEHLNTQRRSSEEKHNAHEFTTQQLNAVALPKAYSMDMDHFDGLIKNLSHFIEAGEISNDLASRFVYQLIAELAKPPQSAPEKQKEPENEKLPARKLDKSQRVTDNLSTKTVGTPVARNSKGAINVKPQGGPEVYTNENVTLQLEGTFFLTKNVSTINLLCATAGVSNLKYTWTKDGMPLKPVEKVTFEADGKVQILNPTEKEMGVYRCTADNELFQDMALFYAEAPAVQSSEKNIASFQLQNLSVSVGGTILARTGTNILLKCPVKGKAKSSELSEVVGTLSQEVFKK